MQEVSKLSAALVLAVDIKRIDSDIRRACFFSSSISCNAVMEAARHSHFAPIIIVTSYATSVNYAGKSVAYQQNEDSSIDPNAAVSGAVALALHVRAMAPHYGVSVILQSETLCLHQLVNWYEGVYAANKSYFAAYQEPLFCSHRLDLTMDHEHDGHDEILLIAGKYLERFERLKIRLELVLSTSTSELCRPCATATSLTQDQGTRDTIFLDSQHDCTNEEVPEWVRNAHRSLSQSSTNFGILLKRRGNSRASAPTATETTAAPKILSTRDDNRTMCVTRMRPTR